MQREFLAKTKNECNVYLDLDTSHAVTHLAHQKKLRKAVERLIPTIEADSDMVRVERDMGEEVGTTDLVETTDQDEIVYALRSRRQIYSRFAKNRQPEPTSWVTITLRKVGEEEYSLYTAFVGHNTPSFPGGDYLPEQAKEFWSKHALVWGTQEVIPGTETPKCPW